MNTTVVHSRASLGRRSLGQGPRRLLAWVGVVASVSGVAASPPDGLDLMPFAPSDSAVAMAWTGEGTRNVERRPRLDETWIEFAVETIDASVVPVLSVWRSAGEIGDQLVPDRGSRLHATAADGRDWIQLIEWRDPIAVEQGLQRIGSRSLGGGRFILPVAGVEVVVLDRMLLLGPRDGSWIDATLQRLREVPSASDRGTVDPRERVRLRLRHARPVDGITEIGVHPKGPREAEIRLSGRYRTSPWPIRPASSIERKLLDRLAGRFPVALVESGVGVLDPRLLGPAESMPEILPPAEVRRRLANRRAVVVDVTPMTIPGLGLVETPSIGLVFPSREPLDAEEVSDLDAAMAGWLAGIESSLRDRWGSSESHGPLRTRDRQVGYVDLGEAVIEATDGHPFSLAAEIAWSIVRDEESGRAFVVVGSSVTTTRRIAGLLRHSSKAVRGEPIGTAGTVDGPRATMLLSSLARMREGRGDVAANEDASVLEGVAGWFAGLEKLEWTTTVQTEEVVEARLRVVRSAPATAGDGAP